MNPSYLPYPSQQATQMGFYQPPLAGAPSQVIVNIGHSTQPETPKPTQANYAVQPSFAPPQPTPLYPQLNIHPTPVFPYPSAPENLYPFAPAVPYPPTGSLTSPIQPNHSPSSFNNAYAPPSSAPLSYAQPNSGCPYPTLTPATSNPKPDSGTGVASSTNSSHKSNSQDSNMAQEIPTVRPVSPFNPQADMQVLRKAMKSNLFSVDKTSIINVLVARSNKQRLEIAFRYENMYSKSLITALQNELTIAGSFFDLMKALLTPLPQFLATELHLSIEKWGSGEKTLVEILCTASNVEIDAIKAEYKRLYCALLDKDLIGSRCGTFECFLAYMVQVRRSEDKVVDETAAAQDAQTLVNIGTLRTDSINPSFVSILCTRSYAHLRRMFKIYELISGKPLEFAVSSQFSGTLRTGLLAVIQCIEDRAGFFADRIYDATSSFSFKDRQLIRIIASRCEIDLLTIKGSYQKRYGKRMESDISRTTNGHYRKLLLALVGGY